jgi:hypothetical protein
MFRTSHASSVTIIPVRPVADPAPSAQAADRGLLRRTLGRNNYSRRTFGNRGLSRRTLGRNNYSRRTFGRYTPSRRTFGRYHP